MRAAPAVAFRWVGPTLAIAGLLLSTAPGAAQDAGAFDHGPFDRLLSQHVTTGGLVDYDAFARSPVFEAYLGSLDGADPGRLGEHERLALWINAYNAWTIALINRHEERESIRNINKRLGIFGGGPWKERLARVGGETWTLDEIEHEVIRERFDEPRIHFALVCAAMGCPPLRRKAYTGAELDRQLEDQGRTFLARSPAKNRVEPAEGAVYLSPVFDWFREDFPEGAAGLGRYLARFFPPGPERSFLEAGAFEIRHTDYDWSLNARR